MDDDIRITFVFGPSADEEIHSSVDIPLYKSGTTKIPADLIARNPRAYKPRTISLGPLHFGQSSVKDSEEKKEYLLQGMFPFRVRYFEDLVDNMRENLSRIRQWYPIADSIHEAKKLSRMMALDGIFLLQFLREISPMSDLERSIFLAEIQRWPEMQKWADPGDFPNLEKNLTLNFREQLHVLTNQEVQEDILKLQNQIPLFALKMIIQWEEEKLQAMRNQMDRGLTYSVVTETICIVMENVEEEGKRKKKGKMPQQEKGKGKKKGKMPQQEERKEKESIAQLVRRKMLQDIMLHARTGTNQDLNRILQRAWPSLSPFHVGEEKLIFPNENAHILGFVYENILGERTALTQYNGEGNQKKILPARAVALNNKGVKFAPYKGPLNKIRFDRNTWTFHLPRIEIAARTDAVMRNLVAFESFGCEGQTKPIKCYVELMDQLINTAEDVEVLKSRGIIHHILGSDQEVADIWNKMREGHDQTGKYGPIDIAIDEVIKFNGSYRIWFSEGVKKFFSKPWLVVSFIAGCIVVITAIVQTIFSGLQLHQH